MKTLMSVLLLMFAVSTVEAQDKYNICLEYMTTNHPNSSWTLQNDGHGTYIKTWFSTMSKPSMAEVEAVWPQASAWKTNAVNTVKADFESWDKAELKALVLVLIDEINILRAKHQLSERIPAQLKTAIKEKLQ